MMILIFLLIREITKKKIVEINMQVMFPINTYFKKSGNNISRFQSSIMIIIV
jgi:hypothetical protein